MKLFLITYCLSLFMHPPTQFDCSISEISNGYWTGIITQEPPVKNEQYSVEFQLKIQKSNIEGISKVYLEDGRSASFKLKGKIKRKKLEIQEVEAIQQSELKDFVWCYKQFHLECIGQDSMYGNWHGISSQGLCNPGKVYLKKKVKDRV